VLGYVLERLLRLLHPLVPFVTEELWTALTGRDSIVVAPWPGRRVSFRPEKQSPADPGAEAEIASLIRLVTQVRRFRSDQGLRPGQRVPAALTGLGQTRLAGQEASIRALLRLASPAGGFTPTGSVQAEGVTVELDTASVIDADAERRRLAKDLAAAEEEVERTRRKLANTGFTSKAPADVIEKTRQRLAAAEAEIEPLRSRLAALSG
jgi:valyl-tRNA synthetase